VTQDELKEVFMQVAVYAGIPAANTAFSIAKEILTEMRKKEAPDE
jgi:3-oxoadipate enol-lactonase/4-carboxymuconolactone decarboxylase